FALQSERRAAGVSGAAVAHKLGRGKTLRRARGGGGQGGGCCRGSGPRYFWGRKYGRGWGGWPEARFFFRPRHVVPVRAEGARRAAGPFDDPGGPFEDGADVSAVRLLQVVRPGEVGRRGPRGRGGRREDVGADLQDGAAGQDDGPLQDVLQLADVARPGV